MPVQPSPTTENTLVFYQKRSLSLVASFGHFAGSAGLMVILTSLFHARRWFLKSGHGFPPGVLFDIAVALPSLELLAFVILGAYHFRQFLAPPVILTLRPDGITACHRGWKNTPIAWKEMESLSAFTGPAESHQSLNIALRNTEAFLASLPPRRVSAIKRQQAQRRAKVSTSLSIELPFAALQTGRDDLMTQLHTYAQAHGIGEKAKPLDPVRIEMPLPPPNP